MNKLFTQTGIRPVCRQLRKCLKAHSVHRLGAILLAIQLCCLSAFAQNRAIKGVVKDDKGQPVAGASVKVKGTNIGTATGVSGEFTLQVTGNNPVLVFTLIGFTTKEVPVGTQSTINVSLTSEATSLNEVVVVGYGTTRKSDLTGAVGQVKAEQLQERPAASLNQALAGRVTGVQVNTNSGRPGGQTNIRVRGFSSINTTNNPLYVVDGVALPIGNQSQNSNAIDYINPADIASVEILKDASATAIYGARGANGVVLVTTKRGTKAGGRINYDVDFSIPTIGPQRVEMLNAQQFLQVENLSYDNIKVYDPVGWAAGNYNSVRDPRTNRTNPLLFDASGQPLYNTDWLKESTQNKLSQNHQLAFTGGNEDTQFGAFVGYRDDNGLLLNSYLERYSGRFTFDSQIKKWIKVGGTLSYNSQEENLVDVGSGGLNSLRMITEALPFLPVKYPNGQYAANYQYPNMEGGSNPVQILNERKYILRTQTSLGNIYSNINLAKGLEMRTILGANIVNRESNQFNGRNLDQISRDQRGTATITNNRETFWSVENYFTYNNKFGKDHSVNGVLGLSWQQGNLFGYSLQAQNFVSDFFETNNFSAGSVYPAPTSGRSQYGLNSYFARFNYGFKDRYLLTFTGRADGTSRVGNENRFSFFPSAAFAWRASDEEFLKGNETISNLKLRTSYGVTGNTEIPSYQSLGLLGTNYPYIFNGARVIGIGTNRLSNPQLRWERTASSDAGIEIGLFKNRINLEADLYYRKTTGMLLDAPLPQSSGYSSIRKNIGSMSNKGLELGINTVNITGDNLSWNTTFNISFNKNEVLSLATPAPIFSGNPNFLSNTGIIRVGESVGSFYGLVRLGTWSESERAEAAKFASYRGGKPILPGDLKYLDVNGDYVINDADRVIIGKSNPDFFGSFINNLKFKNIDLTLDLQFMYGNNVLNQTRHSGEDRTSIANSFNTVLNAWTPQNQNTDIAAIRDTRAGYVTNVDSHWIEDGSFIRGRNAILGYTFPASITQKLHLSRLRIYASSQNFFLITKYTGNDPEVTTYGDAFAQGQTFFDYPKPTTYLLGLNIGL